MIIKGMKYRIYPTKAQKEFFAKSFGCARYIYNWGLATKRDEYEKTKKSSTCYALIKKLPLLKKENEWLSEVYAQSLQASLRNLDSAFKKFFKKQGKYPRFKKKAKNDFCFQIPQGASMVRDKLSVPKVKDPIKMVVDRPINGKIKTTTISKNGCDQYFVSFCVETESDIVPLEEFDESRTIGIDLGIKDFTVISDGRVIPNPRHLNNKLKRLKKIQRRHSRKIKGSNNRNKARKRLAKMHVNIANSRKDFLHKLTHGLTHDNQVGTIAIENLAVSNMVRNHCLAQAISDVGWGEFRIQLTYKCLWYGKNLIVIDRFAPSSKYCPECGELNDKLTLADREWTCSCGAHHNRDLLASGNIRDFGIKQYRGGLGNLNACGEERAYAAS
jgi:putative transposase